MRSHDPTQENGLYAVGLCIDEAYVLPALVTVTSLADSLQTRDRQSVAIRVLTQDMRPTRALTVEAFTRHVGFKSFDLAWQTPPSGYTIVEGKYITTTTYLRFQLAPGFIGRPYLIYLDADVLVLGDI